MFKFYILLKLANKTGTSSIKTNYYYYLMLNKLLSLIIIINILITISFSPCRCLSIDGEKNKTFNTNLNSELKSNPNIKVDDEVEKLKKLEKSEWNIMKPSTNRATLYQSNSNNKAKLFESSNKNVLYELVLSATRPRVINQILSMNGERRRRQTSGPASLRLKEADPLGSVGNGGEESLTSNSLSNSLRKLGSRLVVGRLIKKADWKGLFVKLVKVFMQYFLDLILNDMFGTTGELLLSYSYISHSHFSHTFHIE